MHKALGIQELVSIEREVQDEPRFRFNAPFDAIDLQFGDSSEILPTLGWTQRSIVWLDYDGRLDTPKLEDLDYLIRNAPSGSVIILSVNAHPFSDIDRRFDLLKEDLGDALPRGVSNETLGGWGTASVYHAIIAEQIAISLTERNAGNSAAAAIEFRQLLHFHYSDGARMLTVGGLMLDAGQKSHFNGCGFEEFDFHRDSESAYKIATPKLTIKEMRHLDTQLPNGLAGGLGGTGIPPAEASAYAEVYRYFPRFIDIDA